MKNCMKGFLDFILKIIISYSFFSGIVWLVLLAVGAPFEPEFALVIWLLFFVLPGGLLGDEIVHAYWIPRPDIGDCTYECSRCKKIRDAYFEEDDEFCARCGARMDGEPK